MRRLLALTTLAIVGTAIAPTTAIGAPASSQECAQAWTVLAREQAGMDANDLAAWGRVNEAFLSLSDANFEGPVSNALGNVSAAAEVIAISLESDDANDPSRTDFTAAVGELGTACAHLTVTRHSEKVLRFKRFSYQSGVVTGLSPTATARVNSSVSGTVDSSVRAARKAKGRCSGKVKACGFFVQTLRQDPCIAGVICIRSQSGLLPPGGNDSQAVMSTLPLSSVTGEPVPLSQVVPDMELFLADLNAALLAQITAAGLGEEWAPNVTEAEVTAWLPEEDGIHVWFDKYAVAPGSSGVMHVVVPWG